MAQVSRGALLGSLLEQTALSNLGGWGLTRRSLTKTGEKPWDGQGFSWSSQDISLPAVPAFPALTCLLAALCYHGLQR